MLEPNITEENAFLRLICGVTTTSIGIARISRSPSCKVGHLMILFGAMKFAEGMFQYCPIVDFYKSDEDEQM